MVPPSSAQFLQSNSAEILLCRFALATFNRDTREFINLQNTVSTVFVIFDEVLLTVSPLPINYLLRGETPVTVANLFL